jgi:hypothetical protein
MIESGTRWKGHVACMTDDRKTCRELMEKPEGNRPLGRHRRRWDGDIKRHIIETGREDVDCIHPTQCSLKSGGLL